MLGEVFYWVLNMSVTASLAGAVLLLLRKIKKLPRRLVFILWAVPFLRMWIPVSIGSQYGLMSLLKQAGMRTVTVYEGSEMLTMMNGIGAAESYFPVVYKVNILENLFNGAFTVWLVGCVVLFGILIFLYVGSKREACRGERLELPDDGMIAEDKWEACCGGRFRGNIRLSEKIDSPAVYGILHPQIVIPASYREKELTYILAHEKVHISRRDNWWRLVAFATACLHWFNPFAWLFLKLFLEDMELACDEKVLAELGEHEKKAYALTLVECAADAPLFASAFGGAKLHKRICHILSYKKISIFSAVCFALLAVGLAFTLLTNGA
ncbi:MAG: M56 family metallopeptidase [Lachnospiraceae bacterium]|nr:M56 family metallopeptidase [Lachnospiraceae bacterium]